LKYAIRKNILKFIFEVEWLQKMMVQLNQGLWNKLFIRGLAMNYFVALQDLFSETKRRIFS